MTSENDPIKSDSKWKNATVLLAPSETAQSISPVAIGDSFSVQFQREGSCRSNFICDLPNGEGPLVKSVTVVMQLHLNLDNIDVDEIEMFNVHVTYGCNKSSLSQSQILCNFEGTIKSVEYRFGEIVVEPIGVLEIEVPASALLPERLSRPTLLLSAFAQREGNDSFINLEVDTVTVSIRGRPRMSDQ